MNEQLTADLQKDLIGFDNDFSQYYAESDNLAIQEDSRAELEQVAKEKGFGAKEPEAPQPQSLLDKASNIAGAVAEDVATGVRQAPRSAVRGATKGVNEMVDFIGDLAGLDAPQLPVIDKPKKPSVTGDAIEAIAQFSVGFKGVDKALKVFKSGKDIAQGFKLLKTAGKGALADVFAFDEHEARLSNVIQKVPALQNPITEFLQAQPDDNVVVGKLKQAIEGSTIGAAGDVLFDSLSKLKRGKQVTQALEAEGKTIDDIIDMPVEEKAGVTLDRTKLDVLGDVDSDELLLKTVKKAETADQTRIAGKLEAAGKATENVQDIAQRVVEEKEININFARIDGPEDIKNVMEQMANDPDLIASVTKARRGVQTDEELLKAADDVDGFGDLMKRREGDALNDRQTIAARKLYYDSTSKLMEAAKKAAQPEASDIDQFAFRKMMALHHAIQQEVLGARAEAARALRAWSLPVGGGDGSAIRQIENLVNEFGGADASKEIAKRLTAFGRETGKLTTTQINNIVNSGVLARSRKALEEAWTLGLLTSPRTHVTNITSNVMTGLTLGLERMSASLFRDTPIEMREGLEYYTAYFGSMKEAFANSAEAWKTGKTGMGIGKVDLPPQRSTSREVLDPNGKGGIITKAIDYYGSALNKYAGGALAAGDEFSKTLLYKANLRSLAFRQARALGMKGEQVKEHIASVMSNPPKNLRADSMEFANYGTYTNALTGGGQSIQRAIARIPAARLVIPFVRTPMNIFKFTFERTPLGFASSRIRDDIAAGGLRRSQALAKIGTGTSVMYLGMDLSLNGQITGAGPSDPKTRTQLRNTGWQPYSIKVGDTYYSYSRFEPFATWLGMSADMTEIMTNYESYDIQSQGEIDELVTATVAAMANQVVGKTFLTGISDMTQMLSDSKRYGSQFLQKYAGSLVPSVVADIERATSPEMSQVFNMIDAMKARIPGLSKDVPIRRNVYGEPIKAFYPTEENAAQALGERAMQIFNPVYFTDSDKKPDMLDMYFLKNGFEGPNMPQKTQNFSAPESRGMEKVAIDLREYPEIYSRFLEKRGEVRLRQYRNMTMREYLTGLVNQKVPEARQFFNPRMMDHEKQDQHISNIVSDYDNQIRNELVEEYPVLRQTIAEERSAQRVINANSGSNGLIRERPFP
jgi:SepF-like predicted cell division protein (DUF552 family)